MGGSYRNLLSLVPKAKLLLLRAWTLKLLLGDIPDEFLDPIQYTFMKDPVILSSKGIFLVITYIISTAN
ncbi:hypothetical protein GBA52_011810 [Prunus armeniaca]|nr:hypothetical protein GBA52_011810 [Prunus armeniaca]